MWADVLRPTSPSCTVPRACYMSPIVCPMDWAMSVALLPRVARGGHDKHPPGGISQQLSPVSSESSCCCIPCALLSTGLWLQDLKGNSRWGKERRWEFLTSWPLLLSHGSPVHQTWNLPALLRQFLLCSEVNRSFEIIFWISFFWFYCGPQGPLNSCLAQAFSLHVITEIVSLLH